MSNLYGTKGVRVFTRYDEVYKSDESNAFFRKLATSHVREIGHEATRQYIAACLDGDRIRDLCDFNPPYAELTAPDAYHVRQAAAFFQKRDDIDFGIDRQEAARVKFLEAELACKATNERFRAWSRGQFQFDSDVEGILHAAQRKISQILGPVPRLSELKFRFGPGATTLRKKKDAHPRYKLGDAFACSEAFLPIAGEFLAEFPAWVGFSEEAESALVPIEIHSGRVQFVPKSWKTDRAIVVEPMLNTMFQLGVGDYMARRLKHNGIDISDQSLNQRKARYGSLTGALATLDLSSASDTISKELVAHLLPLDWYSFLCFGRTPTVEIGGRTLRQEKFSSMGNGFTFPLETLIFYALTVSSCEGVAECNEVSVYGDDIIVPSHRFPRLVRVLTECGFTPNEKKSFYFGSFRESCGADYLCGKDIRPFYQSGVYSCESAFLLHNFYVRRGDPVRAAMVERTICKSVRLYGPDGYGDGHLLGEWHRKPHNRVNGWGGYLFETYKLGPRTSVRIGRGECVLPSYSIYASKPLSPLWDDSGVPGYVPLRHGYGDGTKANNPVKDFVRYDKEGRLSVTLPGTEGYKRISIYTF